MKKELLVIGNEGIYLLIDGFNVKKNVIREIAYCHKMSFQKRTKAFLKFVDTTR